MAKAESTLNWLPMNARVTTSGQPSEEQLDAIRGLGTEVIINLGLHSHPKALPDEGRTVQSLGMSYIHIPVEFEKPTEEDYRAFRDTMDARSDARVHVHCIVNARVTAFMYRYQQERLGVAKEQARIFMEKVWRPGGVWAEFVGDHGAILRPHQYARRDY